jgi:hypothetical protein
MVLYKHEDTSASDVICDMTDFVGRRLLELKIPHIRCVLPGYEIRFGL